MCQGEGAEGRPGPGTLLADCSGWGRLGWGAHRPSPVPLLPAPCQGARSAGAHPLLSKPPSAPDRGTSLSLGLGSDPFGGMPQKETLEQVLKVPFTQIIVTKLPLRNGDSRQQVRLTWHWRGSAWRDCTAQLAHLCPSMICS